jgi:homopolymeric O-antigen transport system permease protein
VEASTSTLAERAELRVIRPAPRRPRLGLREVWRHRELLYFFAWRELKVRYKQTLLGVVWAVLQPVMYMIVFTLFFGKFAGLYSPGPYALLTLSGSVIWLFFANSVTLASGSLVGNASLLTKVWFPRLLAPLAPVLAAIVDLALSTLVLIAVMAGYGQFPAPHRAWTAIPFVLVAMATAFGVGAWLAALNVKYRDIRFVVPFLLQLWLFASPVVYSSELLEGRLRELYYLNPMAGVVEGFRWSLLGGVPPAYGNVLLSALVGGIALVGGVLYFRRTERSFADIV